jgi:hypothetical protein
MAAHALVGEQRSEEARQIVRKELDRYRQEQKHGANGVSFQRDLAYALYVDAIAQPATDTGRVQRASGLAEAERAIAIVPTEARQLYDVRLVTKLIAAARQAAS